MDLKLLTEKSSTIKKLTKIHFNKIIRAQASEVLIEGINGVKSAIKAQKVQVIYCTTLFTQKYPEIIQNCSLNKIPVVLISQSASEKLTDTTTPVGVFALVEKFILSDSDLDNLNLVTNGGAPKFFMLASNINEPGNAGSLIRLADAFGCTAIFFTDNGVDCYNPKLIRTAVGSMFHLPIYKISNTANLLSWFKKNQIITIATTPSATKPLSAIKSLLSNPVCWFFGNEAHGLNVDMLANADEKIVIEMIGKTESINIVNAAAICLYVTSIMRLSELT